MVRRILVEKIKGFDVEAKGLFEDIKSNLNMEGLWDIRILNRYDVEGIDEEIFEKAKVTIFSEPPIDLVYEETAPFGHQERIFAVSYLPGQYDQRADSAMQCIRLIHANAEATVKFARVISLVGKISEEEFATIKQYCINPVDSEEVSMEKPDTLAEMPVLPKDVEIVENFISLSEEDLYEYKNQMGFAMSKEDLRFVQDYFQSTEERNPTITELKVIDTYWSDHCRHTTFLTDLNEIQIGEGRFQPLIQRAFEEYLAMRQEVYDGKVEKKSINLMDIACIGAKYLKGKGLVPDLDESDEINACSIKATALIGGKEEDWIVMFKNETHNHPTEIEPFGGAATCLGGAIRDPLSGRVYVYQAMRVTGSGDPRTPVKDTLPGKLPQSKITKGAAAGYSSYGNQIGLATGQVAEIYHPGYVAKRMEVGAVIGAAPAENIRRENPETGDVIILVGGGTGRDGCGGATGSSKEHTEDSIFLCGAEVQKGNPPVERNIQRLFRQKKVTRLIKKCNDFGAGGVSVAIGELADSLDINLDLIPKKYEGLDGTELAISESQERMAVVVAYEDADQFLKLASLENLEAVVVALVTDTGRIRMFWREKCILDLSREFLNTNGVQQHAGVHVKSEFSLEGIYEETLGDLAAMLGDLNHSSQKGLSERFDSTIGAATVVMPLGGKYQMTPALGMAAKLPVVKGETTTATLMTYGFDPVLSSASPYHGAVYAVLDSVTKQVAMGSDMSKVRLTFQEYFERLGTNKESWGKPFSALLGALKVQKELGIPAIGGKDSMSGTFLEINVPPTLISFAVSVLDSDVLITNELKPGKSKLVYLKTEKDEEGMPDFLQYRENMKCVEKSIRQHQVLAASTIGRGGIFVAAANMAIGNKIGLRLHDLSEGELRRPDYGSLLLQIGEKIDIGELFQGLNYRIVGETNSSEILEVRELHHKEEKKVTKLALEEAIQKLVEPLENIFPTRTKEYKEHFDDAEVETFRYVTRNTKGPLIRMSKPKVIIPAFPGTNCEVDSKRAFEKAGAEAEIVMIRNRTESQLIDSIRELERKIKTSQIIMIPGGFSGGDEPDGSAKFITAVFRNPRIMEAVRGHLDKKDGLMLGICNGFQALIKLGLVPYGEIRDITKESPTLTYNKIGRHASCLVQTRIASVKSPWMAGVNVGDVHLLPVSHGEGRFIASRELVAELGKNGQIATQYVDFDGNPCMDIQANPNYSDFAIEGITSPDGRVLGKMAHSERIGKNLYKNCIGDFDQHLFESGVAYFKIG